VTGPAPLAPVPVPSQPSPPASRPAPAAAQEPAAAVGPPAGATEPEPEPGPGASEPEQGNLVHVPTPPESERSDDDGGPSGDPFDEGMPPDPFGEGIPPDPFGAGTQPDPFAEATPQRPVASSDRASDATGGPAVAHASAEALAEAAAGDRLELLRSVFPGRVLRLVPHAAPGAAGGRTPALDDGDAVPLDTPADADGVGPDSNEPGGSA